MWASLKCDSLEAILAPDVGGGVAAFRVGGRPVFHPDALRGSDARALGEFPMGPYVNRIAYGSFAWDGRTIAVSRNFGDHPHPLHGFGWQARWGCTIVHAGKAVMTLQAKAQPAWPWAVTMTRTVTLHPDALEIALAVTNDDARAMPASLGSHPYFPARDAIVRLHADAQLMTTTDGVPTQAARTPVLAALAAGAPAGGLDLDHCLEGWDGAAEIVWPDLSVRIETEPPQRFVQVYAPPGANFFCIEPQSAPPDAVNRGAAHALAPGETLAFTVRFIVR